MIEQLGPWSHWIPDEDDGLLGRGGYQVMIRSSLDPERRPRGDDGKSGGEKISEYTKVAKSDPMAWRDVILGIMDDGMPRTFNWIGVEAMDKTADIIGGTPFEECLWQLVAGGELEATTRARIGCSYILFRKKRQKPPQRGE